MALPDYLQDTAKDFAKQLTATTSVPINTGTFTGRQFVAGEDPMQTQAINLASQGVGSYQPFLTAAQGAVSQQAGLTGPQAFQQFMSPFQQQVIDTTLSDFDRQASMGRQGIRDQAFTAGAFGGGREGVQMAEYDSNNLRNRASLLASLQQQGFTQANQLAQNAFQQQGNLASQQMGLSNFQRGSLGQDVSALGNLGAFRQGLTQSQLQADAQAARTGAYEPVGRLDQYGAGLGRLAGFGSTAQPMDTGGASPFATGLSTATGIAGIFGKLYGSGR
jgi:hypothetical protein|tara:strand:+ start:195 stop:1022 length:828 start_codon:yes stop_codon:yes gene_type:complete